MFIRGERSIGRLQGRQKGFTLVELLVVVAIIVALAAVSVVSVARFTGKGEEGATAAELTTIQAAMDAMMADVAVTAVTAQASPSTGANDFTALPTGTGVSPLLAYLRVNPSNYWYCWDTTGKVSQLLTAVAVCP